MPQTYEAALAAYERFDFTAGAYTRPVYMRGEGPAVVIIHEIPGLHPLVVRFADRIAAAGMSVYLPGLFGEPGRPVDGALSRAVDVLGALRAARVQHLAARALEPDRRLAAGAGAQGRARAARRARRRRGRACASPAVSRSP